VFVVGAVCFWHVRWPAMNDLPQHAAQVSMLVNWLTAPDTFERSLQVELFTPYLLFYAVSTPLAMAFGVTPAVKISMTIFWALFVAAVRQVRASSGGPAYLEIIALAGYFGFAYHWGFATFLAAAPLGIMFLLRWRRGLSGSSTRGLLLSSALCLALFFSHALVFAYVLLAALMMTFASASRPYEKALQCAALLPAIALALFWLMVTHAGERQAGMATEYLIGLARIPNALSLVYGVESNWLLCAATIVFCVVPIVLRAELRRSPVDLAPAVAVIAILLFMPHQIFGNHFSYQRFAVLLFPAVLFAVTDRPPGFGHRSRVARLAALLLPVLGLALALALVVEKQRIVDAEQRGLQRLLAMMENGQRTIWLPHRKDSLATGYPVPHLHAGVWYQAEKGGIVDFNFAWFYPQPVRYRVGQRPSADANFVWFAIPESLANLRDQDIYRYLLLRSDSASATPPAAGREGCVWQAAGRQREWQLFERRCPSVAKSRD
jgi:hypothetical protein